MFLRLNFWTLAALFKMTTNLKFLERLLVSSKRSLGGSVQTKLNSLSPEMPSRRLGVSRGQLVCLAGWRGDKSLGFWDCVPENSILLVPYATQPPNLGKTKRAVERKPLLDHFSSVAWSTESVNF
jgi:hypothetical protein